MAAGRSWERSLVNSAESALETTLANTGGSISIEPFAFLAAAFLAVFGPFVERQAGFSDAHKSSSLRLGLRDSGKRNSARPRAVPGHNFLWKDYKRLRQKSKRLIFHIHDMWK